MVSVCLVSTDSILKELPNFWFRNEGVFSSSLNTVGSGFSIFNNTSSLFSVCISGFSSFFSSETISIPD